MIEVWRNVVGYEGYYEVSNRGRVKSLKYGKERILKLKRDKDGYLRVNLSKNGKVKTHQIHRLVGMAFPDMVGWTEDAKGRPFSELQINHKKEKEKANNHVENLEWCDGPYNLEYGDARERQAKALTNGKTSKPVVQKTKDGEIVNIWPSVREIERQTGWNNAHISACCRGEHKSAYGYCWEYVEQ